MWSKQGFVREIIYNSNDFDEIKTVVLFSGCPLRCAYCDSVDLWKTSMDDIITLEALFTKLADVDKFVISGGEPLSQPQFLINILKTAKKQNKEVYLDTSGFGNQKYFDEINSLVDLVYFDLKESDPFLYPKLTGVVKRISDQYLLSLNKNLTKVIVRSVIVPDKNDFEEKLDLLVNESLEIKNLIKLELLGYKVDHIYKYKDLNIDYKLKGIRELESLELLKLQNYVDNKIKIISN